jgi:hypothetical protein
MKRIAPYLIAGALVSAGLLAGCDSQASLVANPATQGTVPTVPANLVVAGTSMSLFFPQAGLTPEMQAASNMKILFGSTAIPMTAIATPAVGVTAPVSQMGGFEPDLNGKQRFVFVLDRNKTQVVDVQITPAP